jgi:hypothetical protein
MDLETICNEVAYLANDTTLSSSGANYARTKAWVREVYYLDVLTLRNDWWFLKKNLTIPVISGTVNYVLPGGANIKKVQEIKISTENVLQGLSQHQVNERFDNLDEIGAPQYFWHKYRSSGSDWIQIYPIPDANYTLNVSCIDLPDNLSADADEPSLPSEWHYLLVKGAFIKALKHNQDPNLQIEIAEYQQMLKRLCSQNARDDYKTDTWWNP